MVPQPRDVRELHEHTRWFLGLGPRPEFDRYTYWEKFDYWAVFWGMLIIGGSGLILWFPATLLVSCPAGCSTSRSSCTARKRCSPWASS